MSKHTDIQAASKTDRMISTAIYGIWAVIAGFWIFSAINPGALKNVTEADRKYEASLLVNKALIQSSAGNNAEAVSLLKRALSIRPDLSEAKINLGVISKLEGNFQEAVRVLKEALETAGSDSCSVYANLSDIFRETGDSALAVNYFNQSLLTSHCRIDRLMKEGIYFMGSDPGRSIKAFESCIEARFKPELYYKSMLNRHLHSDDTSKARLSASSNALSKGISRDDLKAYSMELFMKMLLTDKGLAENYNKLGFVYAQAQRYREAKDCFTKALEVWSDYPDALSNLEFVSGLAGGR